MWVITLIQIKNPIYNTLQISKAGWIEGVLNAYRFNLPIQKRNTVLL